MVGTWWAGECMVGWWWASFDKISLIGGPVPLLCLSIIAFLDQLLGVWSLDMNQQDVWKFFCNWQTGSDCVTWMEL